MSIIKPTGPKLDSVDSIYHYLREEVPTEVVVSSTTPSSVTNSTRISSPSKMNKRQKKEKNFMQEIQSVETNPIEILPTGRVRYGPITVNPRKQPSKTLFTGRRSKYEVLIGEEEEKRRLRRERNRLAALKCRVKRDDILNELEYTFNQEMKKYTDLQGFIQQLEQKKQQLEIELGERQMTSSSTNMIFGNPNFLSSIVDPPTPRLPLHQVQLVANHVEEFIHLVQPIPILTNSAYPVDESNYYLNSQANTMPMNSSSFERILNNLASTNDVDSNNNNTTTTSTNCTELFNSAYASSTCAQQHSSSSEDDSMPSAHRKSIVF